MTTKKKFIDEEQLLQDAYRLGVQIYNSGFRPSFIVGLWRGGSSVGISVQECLQYLGVETDHICIRTSYRGVDSYQQMVDNAEQEIRIHGTQYLLENLNADDKLLIVDDVMSSGLNVEAVITRLSGRLKRNMPDEVRVAVPWWKPSRKKTQREPDYYLYKTEDWLVMPYEMSGLSEDDIQKNKPYLANLIQRSK